MMIGSRWTLWSWLRKKMRWIDEPEEIAISLKGVQLIFFGISSIVQLLLQFHPFSSIEELLKTLKATNMQGNYLFCIKK